MASMAVMPGYYNLHPPSSPTFFVGVSSFQGVAGLMAQPQPLPRLAQSRSKKDFFSALGWDEKNEGHKRLYGLMKEEASRARTTLSADRSNLTVEAKNDPRVVPPFSSSQMTEVALFQEVLRIERCAGPETRHIYPLGTFYDNNNRDNWIIRWVLWHVFRYRDPRNGARPSRSRPTKQRQPSDTDSDTTVVSTSLPPSELGSSVGGSDAERPRFSPPRYDPVRDALLNNDSR